MEKDLTQVAQHNEIARTRRIKPLSTHLANQIAAGEVINRPASVVKECLENAIDAGATQINIDIEEAGIRLIRIKDNGGGIEKEDLSLAISAHATSKVYDLNELTSVSSLGFRGEALASISSISKFSIYSKSNNAQKNSDHGWKIIQNGREDIPKVEPVAHPVGTTIEVRDLFFNTPARLKFLKKEKTEFSHIQMCVKKIALSNDKIGINLTHNGNNIYNIPGVNNNNNNNNNNDINENNYLKEKRIGELISTEFLENSIIIECESLDLKLTGYVGLPTYSRSQADWQYFYVNGRIVKDPCIAHAIKQAYKDVLYHGRHPVFVLYFELPADGVDVNVHPTKSEVRFRDSKLVHDFIYSQLNRALASAKAGNFDNDLDININNSPIKSSDNFSQDFSNKSFDQNINKNIDNKNNTDSWVDLIKSFDDIGSDNIRDNNIRDDNIRDDLSSNLNDSLINIDNYNNNLDKKLDQQTELNLSDDLLNNNNNISQIPPLGYAICQLKGIFLLAENKQGLVIIDMHAAHERITYEKMKKQLLENNDNKIPSQNLLVPVMLDVGNNFVAIAEEYANKLSEMGLNIDPIGETKLIVRSVPNLIKNNNISELVLEILEDLEKVGKSYAIEQWQNKSLSSMACHNAVRANDIISKEQMNNLLRDLEKTDRSGQCNHGRPTTVTLDQKQLDNLFIRGR